MSLLLDALKKAAEKKAKKSSEQAKVPDTTELADDEKTIAIDDQDDTALNDTIAFDQETTLVEHESTLVDSDSRYIDTTQMDSTEMDATQINKDAQDTDLTETTDFTETSLTDNVTFDQEPTQLDQAEETIEMEATSVDFLQTQNDIDTDFADTTQMDSTHLTETSITDNLTFDQESTQLDQAEETIEMEATSVDFLQTQKDIDTDFVDTTQMDSTEMDATQVNKDDHETEFTEPTHLTETSITDNITFDQESTRLDQAEETMEMEATATDFLQTQKGIDTGLTDTTQIDSTEMDEVQVKQDTESTDSTHLTETSITDNITYDQEPTQLGEAEETVEMEAVAGELLQPQNDVDTDLTDSTQSDQESQTVVVTGIEETDVEGDDFDTALIDTIDSSRQKTEQDQSVDSTRMAEASQDKTEIKDDTELRYQSGLAEEDRTLFIYDGADTTESVSTSTDSLYRAHNEKDDENLTEDDVTQFMGDGYSDREASDSKQQVDKFSKDDTTLTNEESLTLTNFSLDDQESVEASSEPDLTDRHSFSLPEFKNRSSNEETITASIRLEDIPEEDKSTRINTDSTSTISSIDIEKLTNEETVTVESSTTNRNYAPDNYDRTLLNLSEKDVSNIFPGMQPGSDTVMTPDYAKRIFLSKSGQVKTRYYKVYAGIGLALLLVVVILGLFQIQNESDAIDQGLYSLKRDPMPGMFKPRMEEETVDLFARSKDSHSKEVDIISKADDSASEEPVSMQDNSVAADETESTGMAVKSVAMAESKEIKSDEVAPEVKEITESETHKASIKTGSDSEIKSTRSNRPKTSSLTISSSSQASEMNRALNDAYTAYTSGNFAAAKSLYNKVLSLDETSRAGILGRAAVHIQENEYQQAINNYQLLLVENPKDSMAMAGLISVANIDPQAGETQLKTLIRDQPESAFLHFALGNMYGSQNRWNEAQGAYFNALQHKPEDPNYAYNLAVSLEHIGKAETALVFYQRALQNSTNGLVTFDDQLVEQRIEVLTQ